MEAFGGVWQGDEKLRGGSKDQLSSTSSRDAELLALKSSAFLAEVLLGFYFSLSLFLPDSK